MDFGGLLNGLNAIRVAYILIKNVLPRTPVSRPQHAPHGFDWVYTEPLAERRLFNERMKMKNERKKEEQRLLNAWNYQERKVLAKVTSTEQRERAMPCGAGCRQYWRILWAGIRCPDNGRSRRQIVFACNYQERGDGNGIAAKNDIESEKISGKSGKTGPLRCSREAKQRGVRATTWKFCAKYLHICKIFCTFAAFFGWGLSG